MDDAHQQIRLLMLFNEVSLRNLKASEPANDFNCLHGRPTTAFAPLAVTLDELADAWKDGKVHMPLRVTWNGYSSASLTPASTWCSTFRN